MKPPRQAGAADAAEIARLAGELGYPADAPVMAVRLEALMADPHRCVYVIEGDGRLAGWIAVERRMDFGLRLRGTELVFFGDVQQQRALYIGRFIEGIFYAYAVITYRSITVRARGDQVREFAAQTEAHGADFA